MKKLKILTIIFICISFLLVFLNFGFSYTYDDLCSDSGHYEFWANFINFSLLFDTSFLSEKISSIIIECLAIIYAVFMMLIVKFDYGKNGLIIPTITLPIIYIIEILSGYFVAIESDYVFNNNISDEQFICIAVNILLLVVVLLFAFKKSISHLVIVMPCITIMVVCIAISLHTLIFEGEWYLAGLIRLLSIYATYILLAYRMSKTKETISNN